MRFRRIDHTVEAFQWTHGSLEALAVWAAQADLAGKKRRGEAGKDAPRDVELPISLVRRGDNFDLELRTRHGLAVVCIGDWIVCDVDGEFRPYTDDAFKQLYEAHR